METILLTGATGFIGSHILEALQDAGHEVICFARPAGDCSHIRSRGASIRFGDIRDRAALDRAVRGCTAIVHAAACARDWGPWRDFVSVNVQGTARLLCAAADAGIRTVVMTGSISSYGEEHCLQAKDESWPDNPHYPYFADRFFPCRMNYYRDSKARATWCAADLARKRGLNLTILEPVWVFGEREFTTGFYEYVKTVGKGMRCMPGNDSGTLPVIYAPDLARAYTAAVERTLAGVHRMIVGMPEPVTTRRLFGEFCRQAGLNPPRLLPKALVYPLAFCLELGATLAGSPRPPLLTRARVNMFYDSLNFSSAKAHRLLGFSCRHTLEQGIENTVRWYRDRGYL
jgi:nucleoside-diphosphate-sugar epimerase